MASPGPPLPYTEPGLLMAYLDRVLVVYQGQRLTEASYRRHVEMLAAEIDSRSMDRKVAVLYDCPTPSAIGTRQRKDLADMLSARQDRLRRTTAAYALATPSVLSRGILRAVFWLAPPPHPYEIVNTTAEAFVFFRLHLPEPGPEVSERAYRALLSAHPVALAKRA